MIAGMMGRPDSPAMGWVVHFLIGIIGYGIALLPDRADPSGSLARGVTIAVVGWLIMMIALMPMAGVGLFGMQLGIMTPVMTLVLHLIFGAVLGGFYGRRTDSSGISAASPA